MHERSLSNSLPTARTSYDRRPAPRPRFSGVRSHRAPAALSQVEQAFQLMANWGSPAPECSLYEVAQASQ